MVTRSRIAYETSSLFFRVSWPPFSAGASNAQETLRIDGLEILVTPIDGKMGFSASRPPRWRKTSTIWISYPDHHTLITIFVTGLIHFGWRSATIRSATLLPLPYAPNAGRDSLLDRLHLCLILVLIGAYSLPILFRQQENFPQLI